MNKTDTGAGIIFLCAIVFFGWLWLSYEQEKIREQRLDKTIPHKQTTLERVAPKTFESLQKRTE